MAKSSSAEHEDLEETYEYRVWGRHKKARKIIRELATAETIEKVDDCYFLVDDPEVNAKIRNNRLKVKRLVGHTRGFERWVSRRHESAASAPAPFDALLRDLRLDRRAKRSYDLDEAVANLDPEFADRAVFVRKHRRCFSIGILRAEITDLTIESTGEVLHTLAIEGEDLDELVSLRRRLGLKGTENVAVHVAIDGDD